jgi:hypothetical protein
MDLATLFHDGNLLRIEATFCLRCDPASAAAAARLAIISSTWKQFSFYGLVSRSTSNSTNITLLNETFDPAWTLNGTTGRIPYSASSVVNDSNSYLPLNHTQPNVPSKGLIVVNMMGRLGNNIFQIGFARILAKRLGGWEIALIYNQDSVFVDLHSKSTMCFPTCSPQSCKR